MDAAGLAVQHRPGLARLVAAVRRLMVWGVRRFVPPGLWRRRELVLARRAMADAAVQPPTGPVVLMMSFRAWTTHLAWETTIAQALRERGARCFFFFCGGGLPICEMGWPVRNSGEPCRFCSRFTGGMIDAARFPKITLNDLVPLEERVSIMAATRSGGDSGSGQEGGSPDFGAQIEPSLLWFFRSGTVPGTEQAGRARRDFAGGAAVMAVAAKRVLDRVRPDVVVMLNGMFYEERIVREAAAARGVRVVSYESGAQRGTLFFSGRAEVPAVEYDIGDLFDEGPEVALTHDEDERLEALLKGRRGGGQLIRRYYDRPRAPAAGTRPHLVALFTNVSWDTAVVGRGHAFASMTEWILETIRLLGDRSDVELAIRVHPAESRWPGLESRERVSELLAGKLPSIPANVRIIAPEAPIDSYALAERADTVLVFSSTVGLEAAAMGKPVCVAGLTHYRGKGFTVDADSAEHYARLLGDLSWARPDPQRRARARRYAYLFFHRAMIPFAAVAERIPTEPEFRYSSVYELRPGRDRALDLICDGILTGSPLRLP